MVPSEVSSPRLTASDGTDMHSSQERAAVSLFILCASQGWHWGPLIPP